jgi:hypothetical protein
MATMKDRAVRYRCRAEELRTLAEDLVGSRTLVTILEMAEDYVRMVESLVKQRVISSDRTEP